MKGYFSVRAQAELQRQIQYVLDNSMFYQKKLDGLTCESVVSDFEAVPFTTKKEILEDQATLPPFGSNQCVPIASICRVHKTSGTTAKPVLITLTPEDVGHVLDVGGECFRQSGLNANDIVMHCLNYNMWAGGYTDHQNLEKTGATVVPFGVGNTSSLIDMMITLKATAIHCTPSYLLKIEQVLDGEFNLKPRDLKLRIALLGAESGLQNPAYRKSIEDKWGFKAMNANYGMSEVLSMIASECEYQRGLHYRAGDKLLLELIEPQSGKSVPIKTGAEGEMVFTNLCKQAQPLIRYRSGDIVKITESECPCGSESPIFEVIGRTDDMIVVKGLNVFVSAFDGIVRDLGNLSTGEYRVLIDKYEPVQRIVIQVEANDDTQKEKMVLCIQSECKSKLGVHVEVQILAAGAFPRVEGKTKRVLKVL